MIVGPDSDLYNNFVSSKIVVVDNTGKQVFGFDQAKVFSDIDFSPNGKKISFIGKRWVEWYKKYLDL